MMGDSESPLDNLVRRTSKRNETPTTSYARLPPNSPLLHSDFARQSTATASSNTDNNSYLRSSYQESEFDYHRYYGYEEDEQNVARESWQTTRGGEEVPTVVVSSPDGQVPRAGRMAIVKPIGTNFSRPGRSVDDCKSKSDMYWRGIGYSEQDRLLACIRHTRTIRMTVRYLCPPD